MQAVKKGRGAAAGSNQYIHLFIFRETRNGTGTVEVVVDTERTNRKK